MPDKHKTYVKETPTMVAVLDENGEIQELRLKGEAYRGDEGFVHVPKSKLENVYLYEIPEEVGIHPVEKVEEGIIHPLTFPIPLITLIDTPTHQ